MIVNELNGFFVHHCYKNYKILFRDFYVGNKKFRRH